MPGLCIFGRKCPVKVLGVYYNSWIFKLLMASFSVQMRWDLLLFFVDYFSLDPAVEAFYIEVQCGGVIFRASLHGVLSLVFSGS